MADELRKNETQKPDEEKQSELLEEPLSDSPASSSEEAESKHEFSSPWRNSDLVLIIKDQKLHVHRLILEMSSLVLCHIFKETDSDEVPLLRTNVSDFVDLLRVIYPQFKNKITLDNTARIYRLAEEYQIESVIEVCREYLVHTKKTATNAMKILVIAQECEADESRKQCYEILKHMTVKELKKGQHFKDLDEQSLRSVLLPKAERLENCLTEIQPQLVGLIDCVLYLLFHSEGGKVQLMNGPPNKCPVHHSSSKASTSMQTRIVCPTCRAMLVQMARNSEYVALWDKHGIQYPQYKARGVAQECKTKTTVHYYSENGTYFDEKILDVLQEMFSLLRM